jgi:hypothetical protein
MSVLVNDNLLSVIEVDDGLRISVNWWHRERGHGGGGGKFVRSIDSDVTSPLL